MMEEMQDAASGNVGARIGSNAVPDNASIAAQGAPCGVPKKELPDPSEMKFPHMFIGSFLPTDEQLLMVMSGSGIGMVEVKRRFAIGSSGNERFIVIAAMDKQVAEGIVVMPHQDASWMMWHKPCSLCEGPRPAVFRGTQNLVESRHLVKMSGPRIRFTSSEALRILGARGAVTADIILEERDVGGVFYTAVVSGLTA